MNTLCAPLNRKLAMADSDVNWRRRETDNFLCTTKITKPIQPPHTHPQGQGLCDSTSFCLGMCSGFSQFVLTSELIGQQI